MARGYRKPSKESKEVKPIEEVVEPTKLLESKEEPTQTTTLNKEDLVNFCITEIHTLITALSNEELKTGGKLPDNIILAIGKLHGAINFLNK